MLVFLLKNIRALAKAIPSVGILNFVKKKRPSSVKSPKQKNLCGVGKKKAFM